MKNLENYGVQGLSARDKVVANGGHGGFQYAEGEDLSGDSSSSVSSFFTLGVIVGYEIASFFWNSH